MIRIERPQEAPEILQTTGTRKTRENCESYDCHPNDYRDSSGNLGFDRGIYGHGSVKEALLESQYRKCCYCELPVTVGIRISPYPPLRSPHAR